MATESVRKLGDFCGWTDANQTQMEKEKLLQSTKFTAGHKESATLEIAYSNHFEDPDLIWTGYIWCKSSVCACMGKPYDEII